MDDDNKPNPDSFGVGGGGGEGSNYKRVGVQCSCRHLEFLDCCITNYCFSIVEQTNRGTVAEPPYK